MSLGELTIGYERVAVLDGASATDGFAVGLYHQVQRMNECFFAQSKLILH